MRESQVQKERLPAGVLWETEREETRREQQGDHHEQEAQPYVRKRKSKRVSDLGRQSLQLALKVRAACLSSADLHRAREKQTASFILLCKDAAGENMGRGGDNIQVAVVPKDKKDRFVLRSRVMGNKRR